MERKVEQVMTPDMNNHLGNRLRELRKSKNLTLKQVGDTLGMTTTAISLYESDARKPSPEVISKLAKLYDTDPNSILGYDSNRQKSLESIFTNKNLTYNGIPLREDELNFIKYILDYALKEKRVNNDTSEDKLCP